MRNHQKNYCEPLRKPLPLEKALGTKTDGSKKVYVKCLTTGKEGVSRYQAFALTP